MKGLSQREKDIALAAISFYRAFNDKKFRDNFDKKQHNIDLNIEEMTNILEILANLE